MDCLLLNPDRVLYVGLLGHPRQRVLGSHTLYVATRGTVRMEEADGRIREGRVVVVPAHEPHTVRTPDDRIACLMLEPEFIDVPALTTAQSQQQLARNLNELPDRLADLQHLTQLARQARDSGGLTVEAFDEAVFGWRLPTRDLEARIARVVHCIRQNPAESAPAAELARQCGLSPSHFMHLFKAQCGVSLRAFRLWKRARSLLQAVQHGGNLTTLAQELGYGDSAYFSNSIRHHTGLRPSDIVKGAQGLTVVSRKP